MFFEEAPDLAEWEDATFFHVWEFLEPRWYSRCDSIFSWSSFLLCRVFRLGHLLTRLSKGLRRFPTWAFTESCALKVVLDVKTLLVTIEVPCGQKALTCHRHRPKPMTRHVDSSYFDIRFCHSEKVQWRVS